MERLLLLWCASPGRDLNVTITITTTLGTFTIGETMFTLVIGIAVGMLLDRWAAMVKKREIDDLNEEEI